MSYEADGPRGLQAPFSPAVAGKWKGSMWHVDDTRTSLITVGNAGANPTTAAMVLYYGQNESYELRQKLAPGEQMWADVAQIIRTQLPDINGRIIPPDTHFGTYDLLDLDNGSLGQLYEGKLTIDRKYGYAVYGCAMCCLERATMYPSSIYGHQGAKSPVAVRVVNCEGTIDDRQGFSWASQNPTIVSIPLTGVEAGHESPGDTSLGAIVTLVKQGQKYCSPFNVGVNGAASTLPPQTFQVQYASYIPVDHIDGPVVCTIGDFSTPLIYKGDAGRGTFRTAEAITVSVGVNQVSGFIADTGETRNYGTGSPANGSTLSGMDEDGIQYDCRLWNNKGKASPAQFAQQVTFPTLQQAQVLFYGESSNPLEAPAPINWSMRTVIDAPPAGSSSAYANFNHTCYPAHQIKVNNQLVYLYTPPRNDGVFLTNCLLLHLDKVIGQSNTVTVPSN